MPYWYSTLNNTGLCLCLQGICRLKEIVPEKTDRNCYDRRYFTSVARGIGIKFSISNNSTSLFGHWLKYCHCASMPFITISLIFKSKWTIQWCIYSQECYSSFILWISVHSGRLGLPGSIENHHLSCQICKNMKIWIWHSIFLHHRHLYAVIIQHAEQCRFRRKL